MLFMLSEIQRKFSAALLDPDRPPPAGVLGRHGKTDERRFAVHRNNLFVGLAEALAARFPVCQRLVGEEFFRAMARAYAAKHRPRSPVLISYGDDFPDFIRGFTPANEVPYLADMAQLEVARSSAYHAAEATPLRTETIACVRSEDLIETRLGLHPSVRLVRSPYPVATIWAAHQEGSHIEPPALWEAEEVLVLRPEADVLMHRLPVGGHSFITALLAGQTLAEAGAAGLSECKDFDLGHNLIGLFDARAIVDLTISDERETEQ